MRSWREKLVSLNLNKLRQIAVTGVFDATEAAEIQNYFKQYVSGLVSPTQSRLQQKLPFPSWRGSEAELEKKAEEWPVSLDPMYCAVIFTVLVISFLSLVNPKANSRRKRYDDYYTSQKGINYSSIVDLASLGLIESNLGPLSNGYQRNYSSLPITIHYYDELISFQEKTKALPIGNVLLTKTGQALCKAIKAEKQDDFWQEICLPVWDQRKLDELNAEA